MRKLLIGLTGCMILLFPTACSTNGTGNGNTNENGSGTDNENGSSTIVLPSSFNKSGLTLSARTVSFPENNLLNIEGELEQDDQVEVYDLGPLSLGDRINVQCFATGNRTLDPMIAMFDADGYRVFWNDDIDPEFDVYDSAFEGSIRYDSDHYYVAVTATDYENLFGINQTGEYTLQMSLDPGAEVAHLAGQKIVLHWAAGGTQTISNVQYQGIPDFNAANIRSAFAGQTSDLQALILDIVQDDYAPYQVEVSTTDDEFPSGQFTTVYFGLDSNMGLFGIADDVDFYNANDEDNAILFLSAFTDISSDLDAAGQAIANVVSHEVGHTLGLMHTVDVTTLMDNSGADITLVDDQSFGIANVADFPIGQQNSPLLLEGTVGLRGTTYHKSHIDWNDGTYRCGTCGATLHLFTQTKGTCALNASSD